MAEPATWEEMEAVIDKIIAMPPDAPVQEMWAIAGLTAEEMAECDRVSVKQIEDGWMAVATDGKTGVGATYADAVADWWRKEFKDNHHTEIGIPIKDPEDYAALDITYKNCGIDAVEDIKDVCGG